MLRKKEERGNHSDGGGGGCVLWPAAPDGCVTPEVNHRSNNNSQ